jgi:ubiquinone/menaquinone biosynthesis C-methylase UbiE
VFHHFTEPQKALQEINRVLSSEGYLAIRNGTREYNKELKWLEFFPEALEIENERTPFGFALVKKGLCASAAAAREWTARTQRPNLMRSKQAPLSNYRVCHTRVRG